MLQQINVFLAITELGSLTAAARALHYTQSTVSACLDQLEKKMGVQLVYRTRGKREITLTPDGEAFLPLARRFANLEGQFDQFVQMRQRKVFRLAATGHTHDTVVSEIAVKLAQRLPDTDIQLISFEYRELDRAVAENTFDIFLMGGSIPEYVNTMVLPLFYEERYILCPADTPLPDRIISPRELDPKFEVIYTGYVYSNVERWREQYFPDLPKPFFRVTTMRSIHKFLTDPRCWAVVPACVAVDLVENQPRKWTYRRVDSMIMPRVCRALVMKSCVDDEAVQCLLQCISEFVEERPYLQKVNP